MDYFGEASARIWLCSGEPIPRRIGVIAKVREITQTALAAGGGTEAARRYEDEERDKEDGWKCVLNGSQEKKK